MDWLLITLAAYGVLGVMVAILIQWLSPQTKIPPFQWLITIVLWPAFFIGAAVSR